MLKVACVLALVIEGSSVQAIRLPPLKGVVVYLHRDAARGEAEYRKLTVSQQFSKPSFFTLVSLRQLPWDTSTTFVKPLVCLTISVFFFLGAFEAEAFYNRWTGKELPARLAARVKIPIFGRS